MIKKIVESIHTYKLKCQIPAFEDLTGLVSLSSVQDAPHRQVLLGPLASN